VPEKDEVQDEVSKKRNMEIKTTIKKDTTLNFPVWQENGTREDFLMHVTAVLDAIKKRGHFEDYNKAAYAYEKAKKANESARAGLALLSEEKELPKKLSKKKAKEAEKEAAAKAAEPKDLAKAPEEGQDNEVTPAQKDDMKASFLSDLEKARLAQRTAMGAMEVAAGQMFSFYSNFLSLKIKYAWNKIVSKQTEGNPYVNLQGDTLEGPRGM
jgi:hypothetical protein